MVPGLLRVAFATIPVACTLKGPGTKRPGKRAGGVFRVSVLPTTNQTLHLAMLAAAKRALGGGKPPAAAAQTPTPESAEAAGLLQNDHKAFCLKVGAFINGTDKQRLCDAFLIATMFETDNGSYSLVVNSKYEGAFLAGRTQLTIAVAGTDVRVRMASDRYPDCEFYVRQNVATQDDFSEIATATDAVQANGGVQYTCALKGLATDLFSGETLQAVMLAVDAVILKDAREYEHPRFPYTSPGLSRLEQLVKAVRTINSAHGKCPAEEYAEGALCTWLGLL